MFTFLSLSVKHGAQPDHPLPAKSLDIGQSRAYGARMSLCFQLRLSHCFLPSSRASVTLSLLSVKGVAIKTRSAGHRKASAVILLLQALVGGRVRRPGPSDEGLEACDLWMVRVQGPACQPERTGLCRTGPQAGARAPVAAWSSWEGPLGAESTGCIGLPLPEHGGEGQGAQEDRSCRSRPRSWQNIPGARHSVSGGMRVSASLDSHRTLSAGERGAGNGSSRADQGPVGQAASEEALDTTRTHLEPHSAGSSPPGSGGTGPALLTRMVGQH